MPDTKIAYNNEFLVTLHVRIFKYDELKNMLPTFSLVSAFKDGKEKKR